MSLISEGLTEAEVSQLFQVGDGFSVFFFDPSVNSWKYRIGTTGQFLTLSTGVTPEEVEDIVGALISGTADIDVSYDDPGDNLIISLNDTGVTAGQYGGANGIPLITIDAKGRVTNISNGPSLVLGDNFYEASSQPASPPSNGGGTLQNAYSFTTPNLEPGKYKVECEFYYEPNATGNDGIHRLLVDGQRLRTSVEDTEKDDLRVEGKDTGGDQRVQRQIKGFVTFATQGTHTLVLQHAAGGGSGTVVTHYCGVEVYRVSP